MHRMSRKLLFAVSTTISINLCLFVANRHFSTTESNGANYINAMQEKVYKQFQKTHDKAITSQQEEAREKQKKDTVISKKVPSDVSPFDVINLMKQVQRQMSYINKTIQKLHEWREYSKQNKKLHQNFNRLTTRQIPQVISDDIILKFDIVEYDVIFLVTSFVRHFERRAWIRNSWGSTGTWTNVKKWKVIFNVGAVKIDTAIVSQQLKQESQKFKDLLILDVPEDFHKLSEKVMVGLKWVYEKSKFKFVLKTDDDIFIQVDRLVKVLEDGWSHENFVGHAMRGQPAERNKGRYGVTKEEWPGKLYDPYCSGGGYLLSHSIIGKMIPYFNWTHPLKIDDAYVGHLVKKAGGRPLHAPEHFLMWNDKCKYTPKMIVSHPAKTTECRDFLMTKANIEMGRLPKGQYKYENETSVWHYKQKLKRKQTINPPKSTGKHN